MHCRIRKLSLPALMISALIFAACSGGDPKQTMGGNNNGTADTGVSLNPDAAMSVADTGILTDAGPTGPCPEHYAGCRCTAEDPTGMADPSQGSCVDPAAICAPYASDGSLAICVFECATDMDCAGKLVGNPGDAKTAGLCRNIGDDGKGICVEAEKADDERCRLHALAGRKMEGCQAASTCLTLNDDSPGEGTCLQLCSPTPQDPTGGCTGDLSFCNPRVFQRMDGTAIGICSDLARGVGAKCGGGYTKQCDTGAGELFCFQNEILDPNGQMPTFVSLKVDEGFCIETCDPDAPSCPGTTDSALGPGVCKNLGTGSQGKLGLCSHECNKLTDDFLQNITVNNCGGPGSLGAGRNCFAMPSLTINQMEGVFGQADICLDVLTPTTAESAVTAELDATAMGVYQPRPKMGTTPADCYGSGENGEIFTCPTGTGCQNIGTQRTPIPACVRNCTTSSTVAVAPYETSECAQSTLDDAMNLVCVPIGKTSTVTINGPWLGFCANAPN
jgi:hypothetical protein